MNEKKMTPLQLFLVFFKIGIFTFGGGWGIVAQMQNEFAEDRKVLAQEDLLDIVSLGRSLPGTMAGNVAYLFGFRQAGVIGGAAALIGITTPPLLVLAVITVFYSAAKDNVYFAAAMKGVRATVAPIIFSALLKLWKSAFPKPLCYAIFAVAAALSFFFKISAIYLILMGVVIGLRFGGQAEAKPAAAGPASGTAAESAKDGKEASK